MAEGDEAAELLLGDEPLVHSVRIEHISDGFRPFEAAIVTHERQDGTGTLGPMRREILRCGSVAVIIPYDPATDSLVLIRQFRVGNALRTPNAAALEFPAGLIDAGEDAATAAARELAEESGLTAFSVAPAFQMMPSPGLCDEVAHVFLALVDAAELGQSAGLADEHEDIRPVLAKADAVIAAVDAGTVVNGFLVAGTHWFARKGRAVAERLVLERGTFE